MIRLPPRSPLFPSTPLFQSGEERRSHQHRHERHEELVCGDPGRPEELDRGEHDDVRDAGGKEDRKSTRLNSSHANISYAVFCLKKKKKIDHYAIETMMSSML